MQLPDLKDYLTNYIKEGIRYPLSKVKYSKIGLLNELPIPMTKEKGWPWTEETNLTNYDKNRAWPKLTIVTPSYNQGAFIEQTIRSVLLQNYPNLEYIIIDGGSTDNTVEIIKKYSRWISYWQSEKDNGQGQAINLGFSLASGDYYAWINSDDYYLPDVFKTVILAFLKTKSTFVFGYGYNFNVKEKKYELLKTLPLFDYFLRVPSLIQPSCFWKAKIHQPIWEQLQCSLDYELWLRLVKGNSRRLIRKPLSVANVHEDAKTHNSKMKAAAEKDHQLICRQDAHGIVANWNTILFWKKILFHLNNLFY